MVDERRARKLRQLKYDDDGEKEWINIREHRFRLLRETARRLLAQTISKANSMEHEREDSVVKNDRGVKRLKSRRVAPKSSAGNDNMDDGDVESGHFASCLVYTTDAADERLCGTPGGRRIIKKIPVDRQPQRVST